MGNKHGKKPEGGKEPGGGSEAMVIFKPQKSWFSTHGG